MTDEQLMALSEYLAADAAHKEAGERAAKAEKAIGELFGEGQFIVQSATHGRLLVDVSRWIDEEAWVVSSKPLPELEVVCL